MNFKIWHKLAILLIATTSLTLVIGIGLSQQSFKRGFLDYRQQQEQQRLESLGNSLLSAYEEKGSWEFLRNNKRLWFTFLRSPGHHPISGRGRFRAEYVPKDFLPQNEMENHKPFRPMMGGRRPPKMALLDTDKQMIVGPPLLDKASQFYPLKSHGKVVAYIASEKTFRIIDKLDKVFAAQQNQAFVVNAFTSLIISIMVALLASGYFRQRISNLTRIAQKLTSGEYEQRIDIKQKDELGQLGNDFNTLAKTLQKNQQSQQQWIADISHELRTPVAILKGELEALNDGIRPLNKNAIHSLQQEIERLNKLIEDLYQLSISDMGALKYEKAQFNIHGLLHELYESFQLRFAKSEIKLNYSQPENQSLLFHGDRQRLYQLLSNLLENSLHYTDTNGEVWIKLLDNKKSITVVIEDSSPGIEEDKLPYIFNRLFRLESSRNRSKGGAGLGLAIAKQIVSAHDGKIIAKASKLGGVQISCLFPKIA